MLVFLILGAIAFGCGIAACLDSDAAPLVSIPGAFACIVGLAVCLAGLCDIAMHSPERVEWRACDAWGRCGNVHTAYPDRPGVEVCVGGAP